VGQASVRLRHDRPGQAPAQRQAGRVGAALASPQRLLPRPAVGGRSPPSAGLGRSVREFLQPEEGSGLTNWAGPQTDPQQEDFQGFPAKAFAQGLGQAIEEEPATQGGKVAQGRASTPPVDRRRSARTEGDRDTGPSRRGREHRLPLGTFLASCRGTRRIV